MPRPKDHGERADQPRNRRKPSRLHDADAEILDDLRQPEPEAVKADHDAEVDQSQRQDAWMSERLLQREVMNGLLVGALGGQPLDEPAAFLWLEPACFLRAICQVCKDYEARDEGRKTFHDEHPLPALEAPKPVPGNAQDPTGEGRANQRRDRHGHHEHADDAGANFGGKPIGQIENDSRKEAGLGDAENESQCIETGVVPDERMADRQNAPGDHDARDPDARADFLQNEVAGHFEKEIAEEEDACAKAKRRRREADVLVHRQGGEADVDPIQIGQEIAPDQKGNESTRDFRDNLIWIDAHFTPVGALYDDAAGSAGAASSARGLSVAWSRAIRSRQA